MLNELSRDHGLLFAYESSLLDGLIASVDADQVRVDLVLREMLSPHSLEASEISPGRYAIARQTQQQAGTLRATPKTLSGRVIQADTGEPLPFAAVRLSQGRGINADESGTFSLLIYPPFPDSLMVTYLGYEASILPCLYDEEIVVELSASVNMIDDIVITDDSREVLQVQDGGSVVQIDPRSLHLLSGLGEPDLLRGLQLLPGMTSANERASGLFIRGGTPAENLILFDGITMYQPGHFFGLLSAFNADAIKKVDLYRSGTGARYGGRTGGVIDITGKPGRVAQPSSRVSANLMNAQVMTQLPWSEGKGGLLISARRSFTDVAPSVFFQQLFDNRFQEGVIYFDRQQQEDQSTLNTILHYYDVNAKWLYRPNERDLISVTAIKTGDELNYSLLESGQNNLDVLSEDQLDLSNQGISANLARKWNDRHYTRFNTAWSGFRNQYQFAYQLSDDQIQYRSDLLRSQWLQDLALRLEHQASLSGDWMASGGFHHNSLWLQNTVSLDDNISNLVADQVEGEQQVYAAFGELSRVGQRAGGELGIRLHLLDDSLNLFVEPRLMLYAIPAPGWRIQANAGRYHQFLNYVQVDNQLQAGEDYWVLADNDSINVMQSDLASLSLSWTSDAFLVQVETYIKRQTGLLAYDLTYNDNLNETDFGELLQNGEGKASGVEVMIQKKTGRYQGWLAYTYSRVFQRFPGSDESAFVPASHDRPHQIVLVNQFKNGPWECSATFIYASGIPYTAATAVESVPLPNGDQYYFLEFGQRNSERLPTYHRLDLSTTYTWQFSRGALRAGASVFNAYGRQNIGNRVFAVEEPVNPGEPASVRSINKPLLGFTPNIFVSLSL